ncbi:MAG: hypothetical protein WCH21_02250 [Bacteroidota bacterium]
MYLQLAERAKKVKVGTYARSGYVKAHTRKFPTLSENENPYIFIPNVDGGGVYIREDKFDSMPHDQFVKFVATLAPYQPEVKAGELSEGEYLASRSERKAARQKKKDLKNEEKESKTKRKEEKSASKAAVRQAKADKKTSGKGFDWDKAGEIGGKLIGKITGKGEEDASGNAGAAIEPTPIYKNPLFIAGGAALLLGGIFLATRKK